MTTAALVAFIALALLGFLLSAIYSGLETGLYTLNPVRLVVRSTAGRRSALRLRREVRHPGRTLIVLLIGTNASNYLGSYSIAELLHGLGSSDRAIIWLQLLFFTPLLFVFAETLPKDLFRTHTDRWTYWLSPFFIVTRWLFTITLLLPLVLGFSRIVSRLIGVAADDTASARQRVSRLFKEGVGAGVLSERQTTLADRVLALRKYAVQSVMISWPLVRTVPVTADRAVREERLREHSHSRLPVTDEHGAVVGILPWSDALLHPDTPIADLMIDPLRLPADMRVRDALATLRRTHTPIAIVESPTRRPLGIITIKDLIAPLTGDMAIW
jgi:CBS domain containing-hemolysin-like protein